MPGVDNKLHASYPAMLKDIKSRIQIAQVKAALSVNRELIELYWDIGKLITSRQKIEGWGKSVVERLSADLRNEFPEITGFSTRNIWRMRSLYLAWTEGFQKLPQAVAEIPWGHNIHLLEKLKNPSNRVWHPKNIRLSCRRRKNSGNNSERPRNLNSRAKHEDEDG